MPAISITDLNNAKLDVDHIATITNSSALTATDRLGNTKDTLAGAISKLLAFNDRGAWVTARSYAVKDLVSNGGTWYVCVSAHTSGATFASDVAAKWRVYQGVMAGDLAGPAGSTLLGDKAAGLSELVGTVRDALGKAEGVSRLFQALNAGRNDVNVLLQSDSTGDEALEFFYRIAVQISAIFPAYTSNYYQWNDVGSNYPAPTTLRAGTGSKFIRFYNAAKPGASPDYYNGARRVAIYDGWKFDLVISNLGLNVDESFDAHVMKMTQYLAQLANDQPQADVLITLQPPDYTNAAMLDRSANRANAQRWVAGQFGCGVIDVYTRFKALVDAAGGVNTAYYLDNLHPTALGGVEWAKVALYEVATCRQLSSIIAPLGRSGPTAMPNGNMDSWLKGTSAAPTFWKTSNCTALKDTATKETGSASARVTGSIASTGLLYVAADDLIYKFGKGNNIVVAARVWTEGGAVKSGNAGMVFCAHSVSTTYAEISSPVVSSVEGDGAWRWVYLIIPPSFYQGRADFWLGVYSGNVGEFTRVDRVLIGNSIHLLESDSGCSYTKKINTSDTGHTVAAGATTQRVFTGMNGAVKGCSVQVESPDIPAGIFLRTVSETDNQITLYVTNLTGASIVVPAMGLMFTVS